MLYRAVHYSVQDRTGPRAFGPVLGPVFFQFRSSVRSGPGPGGPVLRPDRTELELGFFWGGDFHINKPSQQASRWWFSFLGDFQSSVLSTLLSLLLNLCLSLSISASRSLLSSPHLSSPVWGLCLVASEALTLGLWLSSTLCSPPSASASGRLPQPLLCPQQSAVSPLRPVVSRSLPVVGPQPSPPCRRLSLSLRSAWWIYRFNLLI